MWVSMWRWCYIKPLESLYLSTHSPFTYIKMLDFWMPEKDEATQENNESRWGKKWKEPTCKVDVNMRKSTNCMNIWEFSTSTLLSIPDSPRSFTRDPFLSFFFLSLVWPIGKFSIKIHLKIKLFFINDAPLWTWG